MANKKTQGNTEATVSTVGSKAAAKVAERIFRLNPDIKEVHVTSDGTAFYGRNDAQNYARTLQNREVESFKRGTARPASAPVKKGTASQSKAPVAEIQETGEIDELTGEVISKEPTNTEE